MPQYLAERRKKWQGKEENKELESNVLKISSAYDFPGSKSNICLCTLCAGLKWVSIAI